MLNPELQKETLRQSDERFRRMIEEIEDYAIILLNKEGVIQNWNKGANKIKGYTAKEIIGKHFRQFYTDQDQANELPERLLAEAAKNGRAQHEGWRVRKDFRLFWAFTVITALHDDDGNVIGFSKITRDLTAVKKSEDLQKEYVAQLEELRRSEERYHRMLNEVKDYAILLLDTDGTITDWNQGAERIKGYTSEEVIGKHFRIFYLPEDQNAKLPEKLLNEAATTGRATHEGWRVRKDGTTFWGSIVITALHDEAGDVIGYSKVTRDLTDKKLSDDRIRQYAAQLETKNQELEEFTYIASHDLKEPLRKVVAFGDLLNGLKEAMEPKAAGYVERMQDSARRMMSLIEDLLQFSRIGKEDQALEDVDLNEIVNRVIQDLEPDIQSKHAVINKEDLPTIKARPLQMMQLFQNLISNALKFNDKDVPIIEIVNSFVTHPSNEPHCMIKVKDNGIGFDDEHTARIFEAFYRLHGRSQYAGSGIGLAICKKIVELHHGSITAEGTHGHGSTFIITLPCDQPEQ